MQFIVPADYARFVAKQVERALIEAALDRSYREDADPRIQKFASVPDSLIDPDASGTIALALIPEKAA